SVILGISFEICPNRLFPKVRAMMIGIFHFPLSTYKASETGSRILVQEPCVFSSVSVSDMIGRVTILEYSTIHEYSTYLCIVNVASFDAKTNLNAFNYEDQSNYLLGHYRNHCSYDALQRH